MDTSSLSGLHILVVSLAVLVIIYNIWSGWRNGVVRQLCRFVALAAAYIGAIFLGPLVASLIPLPSWPPAGVHLLAAVVVGIVAFLGVTFLSNTLFRKTSEQESGLMRFFYGLGGAFIGLIISAVFLIVLLVGIRATGTVAESQMAVAEKRQETLPPARQKYLTEVSRAKKIVENGAAGPVLRSVDPIPESVYQTLDKIARVTADPAAMQRMLEFPGTRQLVNHPSLAKIARDPSVQEDLGRRDWLALMKNPKVIGSFRDETLLPALQKFDLNGALDYALNPPAPVRIAPAYPTNPAVEQR